MTSYAVRSAGALRSRYFALSAKSSVRTSAPASRWHPPDDADRPLRTRERPFSRGSSTGAFGQQRPYRHVADSGRSMARWSRTCRTQCPKELLRPSLCGPTDAWVAGRVGLMRWATSMSLRRRTQLATGDGGMDELACENTCFPQRVKRCSLAINPVGIDP